MDMSGKDGNAESRKGCDGAITYHESNASSDWQGNGNNLANASIGMIPIGNSMAESSSRSSAAMVDSFGLPIWGQNNNRQSLGYSDVNVENGASNSGGIGLIRADMDWASNGMFRGGMFLPTVPGMVPQILPHFPADSTFIERAARFSCFSGGNFGEMMNPASVPDPLAAYSRGFGMMQGTREVLEGNESKAQPGGQSQQIEMITAEVSRDALLLGRPVQEGVPCENEKRSESFIQANSGAGMLDNESDEAEFSGHGAQDKLNGPVGECHNKGFGSKKRKRGGQDNETDENTATPQPSVDTLKDAAGIKQQGDQNATSISKPGGKHSTQGSQGSDLPKEEYIHVRARRGQATNSHSLAERVRREKISERMKFLQDLVPGCSKVTGKAVMLDEIINYVQSLQRQVEFLSMKLATVNPRLDFNIEVLSKDPRAGLATSLAFPPNMTMPFSPLHLSQPGLIQGGFVGNSAETPPRTGNLQTAAACGGYKEPTSQVPSVWDDELHNVVHMGINSSTAVNSQDLSGSLPPGHMKTEP